LNNTVAAAVLLVVYFSVLIAVGPWAARKISGGGSVGYVLAGRAVPLWIVVGGVFATWVNTATLLGYGGVGYSLGIAGYWAAVGFLMMNIWMGYAFIGRLRKINITTVPELFERYFGVSHRMLGVVLVVLRDLGVSAGIMIGMGVVFQRLFDVPLYVALIITLGVVLVFLTLGGMWAVMVTDTIQAGIIILGSVALIPIGIANIGGWGDFTEQLPPSHYSLLNAGVSQTVGWLLLGIFITVSYQTLIQRGLAARSDEVARKAFMYGGTIALLWYIVPFLIGTIAVVAVPDVNPEGAYLAMIDLANPFVAILLTIVLIAAATSTLSSTILTTASNLSVDIYGRLIDPDADNRRMMLVNRISVLIVTFVAVLIGYLLPYILELLWLGGRIAGAGLGPVLLAVVFWPAARRATKTIFIAMLFGALATVATQIISSVTVSGGEGGTAFVWQLDPMLVGVPVTIACLLIGVFLEGRPKVPESSTGEAS
jgi:SSS family solute:Na+ symporter